MCIEWPIPKTHQHSVHIFIQSLVEKEEKVAALGVLVKSLTEANQVLDLDNY